MDSVEVSYFKIIQFTNKQKKHLKSKTLTSIMKSISLFTSQNNYNYESG